MVWYLGGSIAEDGVNKDSATLIDECKNAIAKVFPDLKLQDPEFGSFRIDRAEGRQKNGSRPDRFVINTDNNLSMIWPTKLALAPLTAMHMQEILDKKITKSNEHNLHNSYPKPDIATPIWEKY